MSITPATAESKGYVSEQSEIDKVREPHTVPSAKQFSGRDCPLSKVDDGFLTGSLCPKSQRPCQVCFDLDLPHWTSDEECKAYRALAIDKTGIDPQYYYGRLKISPRKLKITAEAGCPSCGLLREIWGRLSPEKYTYFRDESGRGSEPIEFRISAHKERGSQSKIITIDSTDGWNRPAICIHRGLENEPTSDLSKALSSHTWLTSQPTLSDVKRFVEPRLAKCMSSHSKCSSTTRNFKPLPARLISVLDNDGFESDPVLVETAHAVPIASNYIRYIALSHCWGSLRSPHPVTTSRDNYKRHLKSIPWTILPKTFQDAILVARALSVQFIWIDSLCIIQDDDEDWAREASKMAGLYENAWLTIAATAAMDGRQGLFMDRPRVEKVQMSRGESSIYFRPIVDHTQFQGIFQQKIKIPRSLPLLSRGWALQEQILSTRVLHFTQEELLWECRSEISCECSPGRLGGMDLFWLSPSDVPRGIKQEFDLSQKVDVSDWYILVMRYMGRDLTYGSDRLPALSGIAQVFQQTLRNPGRYLAGLWEIDLIRGLLWMVVVPGSRSSSHQTHLSSPPSWSWASMGKCHIRWLSSGPKGTHAAEVTHASCIRSTVDDKGMVSGGTVTLRGKLLPLTIHYDVDVPEKKELVSYAALPMGDLHEQGFTNADRLKRANFSPDVLFSSPSENLPPGSVLYFLPLIKYPVSVEGNECFSTKGIFLRQLPAGCSKSVQESSADTIPSPLFARVGCGLLDFLLPSPGDLDPYARLGEYGDTIVTIK